MTENIPPEGANKASDLLPSDKDESLVLGFIVGQNTSLHAAYTITREDLKAGIVVKLDEDGEIRLEGNAEVKF